MTAAALRALGSRRVTLRTAYGDLTGRIAQREIPETAVVVMFASEASPGEPLVVALAEIAGVEER